MTNAKVVVAAGLVCAGCVALLMRLAARLSPLFACALLSLVGMGGYILVLLLLQEPNALALAQLLFKKTQRRLKKM